MWHLPVDVCATTKRTTSVAGEDFECLLTYVDRRRMVEVLWLTAHR